MEIVLEDIGKQYGAHWIFRHVQAHFSRGNIYPIIGNNGSGKSTLLQIISGFVTPNEGTVRHINDKAETAIEHWYKHISIAAPYMDLFEEFTVLESINIHKKMKAMHIEDSQDMIEEIELWEHRNKTLTQLSSGMRQRLKLALAIHSSSDVLLLDEPCSNLDERWADWFNETLTKYASERITIISSNSQENELKSANQKALDISAVPHRE